MAGRLDVSMAGRPVCVLAEGGDVVVSPYSIRTLYDLCRHWRFVAGPLEATFRRANLRLLLDTGWLGCLELLPNPNPLVRLILPRAR